MINFNALHEFSDEDSGRVYVNNTEVKQVFFNGVEVYAHKRWRTVYEGDYVADTSQVLNNYSGNGDIKNIAVDLTFQITGIRANKPTRITFNTRAGYKSSSSVDKSTEQFYDNDATGTEVVLPTDIPRYANSATTQGSRGLTVYAPTADNQLQVNSYCLCSGQNYGAIGYWSQRWWIDKLFITKIEQYF